MRPSKLCWRSVTNQTRTSNAAIDATIHSTTFRYDALGRRIGRTLPGTQSESYGYDLTGNLVYQTNCNGVVITNQYDPMNRLTNRLSAGNYQVSFVYNATNGLRTSMADVTGTTAYQYDALSRLTQKTVAWTNGPTVSLYYGYDATGMLTSLESGTGGGVANAYQYDVLGRLTNVLANGSAAAGYNFDAVGNLQAMRFGSGVTNLYQYDARNRLTNLVWKLNSTSLASFAYTVAPTGNRTALAEVLNGTSRTYAWTYDLLYRMTGEAMSGLGVVNYQFDAVGNRTNRSTSVSGLNNQAFIYNPNDWLTNTDSYDSNGNTTASSGTAYQYDAMNHLTNANGGSVVIGYDGDGNRAKKTVGGTTTYYLLDDRNPSGYVQVVEEYQGNTLSVIYNYGLNVISQKQIGSGTIRYFGYDGHGSTRFLTDASGTLTDTYVYDAYGNKTASTGSSVNKYLYCGEQFDNDLNFYYLRARYYKPDTGRFWTMDSYEGNGQDPLTLHKYLYVRVDPINGSDPSGRITVKAITKKDIALVTDKGSYAVDWKFTLDKAPPEDGYIVQEIPVEQDGTAGRTKNHYWEAWFVPAATDGSRPEVTDHWKLRASDLLKGTGSTHTKIKYFFKSHTGDLGDYRTPPAKPDPSTGWHPGDGHDWSLDLPWKEPPAPKWWGDPSDNGEADASINLDTAWEFEAVGKVLSEKYSTITITPETLFGL